MSKPIGPQADYDAALWERTRALSKLEYLDPVAHARVAARAQCGNGTTEQVIENLRTFTAEVQALIDLALARPAIGERAPSASFVYGQLLQRLDEGLERLEPEQRAPFEARLGKVRAGWGATGRAGGPTDDRARTEELRPVLAEIEALAQQRTN